MQAFGYRHREEVVAIIVKPLGVYATFSLPHANKADELTCRFPLLSDAVCHAM